MAPKAKAKTRSRSAKAKAVPKSAEKGPGKSPAKIPAESPAKKETRGGPRGNSEVQVEVWHKNVRLSSQKVEDFQRRCQKAILTGKHAFAPDEWKTFACNDAETGAVNVPTFMAMLPRIEVEDVYATGIDQRNRVHLPDGSICRALQKQEHQGCNGSTCGFDGDQQDP